ncbi:MAG TPA: hypothetical protein VMH28_18490 [Candidatus Acidoferrales bacterium]|nr:hypothetical protein [Candidatus Acidoferrales bacterium]
MASYISSNANRFYTALENSFGKAEAIAAANRIPAVKLSVRQQVETGTRRDKTGSRTFAGLPQGVRRKTDFELQTYLTSWDKTTAGPGYGPLFQAALGAAPLQFAGASVASSTATGRIGFATAHGLSAGQAVANGGEIRFVAAIVDAQTVQLNAPFTVLPANGSSLSGTVTYSPATDLKSVSIFDYWSPATSVQRLVCGAAVDQLEISINSDYHEFRFSGVAQDVVDSTSFASGAAQLESFPAEPALGAFDYSIVPGHMGQAWLGATASQFFTVTKASITLKNALDTRNREFGTQLPQAISPGRRTVEAAIELYTMDDDATKALYQAARQQSPISVMFQLGEAPGQLMGVYLKSVMPEVPEFDDGQNRLQWKIRPSKAQGTIDDEIAVAFA